MEVRKGAHGVSQLQYHVAWVTNYRRRILKPFVVDYLKVVWSPGYFISGVGVNEEAIRRYVEYQGRKDSDQLHMEL